MSLIPRLVVAYDFSDPARRAFELGVFMGRQLDADVHIVTVLDSSESKEPTASKEARRPSSAARDADLRDRQDGRPPDSVPCCARPPGRCGRGLGSRIRCAAHPLRHDRQRRRRAHLARQCVTRARSQERRDRDVRALRSKPQRLGPTKGASTTRLALRSSRPSIEMVSCSLSPGRI